MQVKKNKNVEQALKNATNGIMLAAKGEKSIHREFGITIVVLILAVIFKISKIELILVILAIALVIVTEMINTAIELCIDMYTDKFSMFAKKAKDIAAGAVVISIVFAGFIGTLVFYDKVMEVLDKILSGGAVRDDYIKMILLIIPVIYMAFELLRKMIKEVKIAIPALTLLIIPVLNSFKIGTKPLIVIAVGLLAFLYIYSLIMESGNKVIVANKKEDEYKES